MFSLTVSASWRLSYRSLAGTPSGIRIHRLLIEFTSTCLVGAMHCLGRMFGLDNYYVYGALAASKSPHADRTSSTREACSEFRNCLESTGGLTNGTICGIK